MEITFVVIVGMLGLLAAYLVHIITWSDMTHTKECTYRNNHDFRHDNCFCTCNPKNEKKKGNLKPELRKNMKETLS